MIAIGNRGRAAWLTTRWEQLVAVGGADEDEIRLGRLFNMLMVINAGFGTAIGGVLFLDPLLEEAFFPLWVAAIFPTAFTLLSMVCII
jgi:hypothetical protein